MTALALSLSLVAAVAANSYNTYCNPRFGHCVAVPTTLRAVTDPANGDGRVFRSADAKTELRTFGSNGPAALGLDARGVYRQQLAVLRKDGVRVTYTASRANFFVISGFVPGGRVYYQKSIVQGGVEYALTLLYPKSASGDRMAEHVSASLKAPR